MTDEQVAVKLATIEAVVIRMETRLFGNGQPGVIDTLERDVFSLKQTEAKARGAFWVLSTIITALGGGLVTHLFKGK